MSTPPVQDGLCGLVVRVAHRAQIDVEIARRLELLPERLAYLRVSLEPQVVNVVSAALSPQLACHKANSRKAQSSSATVATSLEKGGSM